MIVSCRNVYLSVAYRLSTGAKIDDLERHSGCYFASFHWIWQFWGSLTTPWLKLDPYCQRQKCRPSNSVFSNVWFVEMFSEISKNGALERGPTHSVAKIWFVQHCTAMWAIAELFLGLFTKRLNWNAVFWVVKFT